MKLTVLVCSRTAWDGAPTLIKGVSVSRDMSTGLHGELGTVNVSVTLSPSYTATLVGTVTGDTVANGKSGQAHHTGKLQVRRKHASNDNLARK